jgi:hypothetical protein
MAITKIPAAGFTGNNFRNIIINGDMSIAQRGTSTASITTTGYYTVDRFSTLASSLGTWTQSQSTDVPTGQGFATSLKMDCTTANAAPAAAGQLRILQMFEGQNVQYLKKGTANAVSLTASFWVKSTKTGTFILELFDIDNSRQISKAYTIDSANTWEKKTITFAGDTTGAFDNDNGSSFQISFWLGAGSSYSSGTLSTTWTSNTNANRAVGQVNLADSTDNDFYITGVQLEAASAPSDFEFLPVDVNLQRCQRYYYKITPNFYFTGYNNSTTLNDGSLMFLTTMRTAPSALEQSGTASDYSVQRLSTTAVCTSVPTFRSAGINGATVRYTVSGNVQGQGCLLYLNTNGFLAWSAEL